MKLPPELHLGIADQLDFPDNMNLRMVDRYFYKLIKPLSCEEGLEAEQSCFALENELFLCNSCHRLRRKEKFIKVYMESKPGLTVTHRFADRSKTLPVPYCIDCGIEQDLPKCQLGDVFFSSLHARLNQILCNGCEEFPELSERKTFSMCKKCWQRAPADWIQEVTNAIFRDRHMSKHCHHSLGCEICLRLFSDCHWVQRYDSNPRGLEYDRIFPEEEGTSSAQATRKGSVLLLRAFRAMAVSPLVPLAEQPKQRTP